MSKDESLALVGFLHIVALATRKLHEASPSAGDQLLLGIERGINVFADPQSPHGYIGQNADSNLRLLREEYKRAIDNPHGNYVAK